MFCLIVCRVVIVVLIGWMLVLLVNVQYLKIDVCKKKKSRCSICQQYNELERWIRLLVVGGEI